MTGEERGRIAGLDVARALAVFGMVAVNFELVLSNQLGPAWLERALQLPRGRASALFVVLAGVGMTLLGRGDGVRARERLARRGLVLLAIGYPFLVLWDGDILHFYGFYFLIGALTIAWADRVLLLLACGVTLAAPLLLLGGLDFEWGWLGDDQLEYGDLWTWRGHLRHLFFNGFHPLVPWMAFIWYGQWLGRRLRADPDFARRILWRAAAVALAAEGLSWFLVSSLEESAAREVAPLVSTVSMPPGVLYVIAAAALATAVIGLATAAVRRWPQALLVRVLTHTGQLALTAYLAHVVLGIGPFDELYQVHCLSLGQVFALWALFCYLAALFSHHWRLRWERGPCEWLLRALDDRPRPKERA